MRLLAVLFLVGMTGLRPASAQLTAGSCSAAAPTVSRIAQPGVIVGGKSRTSSIPYSLVRMNTQVQTLSNGVQITTRTETREWRDAEGRRRIEIRTERNGEMELQNVSISDPVARENIILHPKVQVAQVDRYSEPKAAAAYAGAYQPRPVDKAFQEAMRAEYQPPRVSHIENKNEPLEPTLIAGECGQGTRWTQTIPTGEIGNDGELRVTSENWWSPRLGVQLRWVMNDPRTGHIVNEVTELHLEAPDPSLFQPPPEYKVFDLTREPVQP